MFKLDDNLLIELGLGSLPNVEKNRMLSHIYETLEMRVGMKLAQQMSNDQLNEFEQLIDQQNEAGALKWLETNFPDYKKVVASELESLKTEIKTEAPKIIAAIEQNNQLAQNNQQTISTNQQQPPLNSNPQMQQPDSFSGNQQ